MTTFTYGVGPKGSLNLLRDISNRLQFHQQHIVTSLATPATALLYPAFLPASIDTLLTGCQRLERKIQRYLYEEEDDPSLPDSETLKKFLNSNNNQHFEQPSFPYPNHNTGYRTNTDENTSQMNNQNRSNFGGSSIHHSDYNPHTSTNDQFQQFHQQPYLNNSNHDPYYHQTPQPAVHQNSQRSTSPYPNPSGYSNSNSNYNTNLYNSSKSNSFPQPQNGPLQNHFRNFPQPQNTPPQNHYQNNNNNFSDPLINSSSPNVINRQAIPTTSSVTPHSPMMNTSQVHPTHSFPMPTSEISSPIPQRSAQPSPAIHQSSTASQSPVSHTASSLSSSPLHLGHSASSPHSSSERESVRFSPIPQNHEMVAAAASLAVASSKSSPVSGKGQDLPARQTMDLDKHEEFKEPTAQEGSGLPEPMLVDEEPSVLRKKERLNKVNSNMTPRHLSPLQKSESAHNSDDSPSSVDFHPSEGLDNEESFDENGDKRKGASKELKTSKSAQLLSSRSHIPSSTKSPTHSPAFSPKISSAAHSKANQPHANAVKSPTLIPRNLRSRPQTSAKHVENTNSSSSLPSIAKKKAIYSQSAAPTPTLRGKSGATTKKANGSHKASH